MEPNCENADEEIRLLRSDDDAAQIAVTEQRHPRRRPASAGVSRLVAAVRDNIAGRGAGDRRGAGEAG